MQDLSLHILDIAENSIDAQAKTIRILLRENSQDDLLTLEIIDDGKGMDKESLRKALDPFYTTKKTRRFGFGLSLISEAARMANGTFSVDSDPGKGTHIKAVFQASHIDTKPFGDIPQTLITLIMGHPEIEFIYTHRVDASEYSLDTQEIKAQLNGMPINSPEVLNLIKKDIREGIASLRR
jgi:anti-sigma regulatory factor (Ser/Thr protein kinase)